MTASPAPEQLPEPAQFWEHAYSDSTRVWSGRPNESLVFAASPLRPGRALDLACGEGADAIWLARRGWTVTGVDISPSATRRARKGAEDAGLTPAQCRFITADLSQWSGDGTFDLVSSCFMHSPVALDRTSILRRMAQLVAPAGHLLVISHGAMPPWAPIVHGHRPFIPEDQVAELALDPQLWAITLDTRRPRQVTTPEGQDFILEDAVTVFQRL
ncbi:Methyltransferase domain-containing protein [Propionibacterium cyclohexanicum]|uniref:Methyltransferase domain-containing protein n=1 Tax=Propionibacterium cyclohexanicum TaxID=64702 RepID=A0A1H9T3B4_9ACTN|nr:class I SAM-dependent methyltransferase [Propionibacterium cyclohexanicum]SER91732.1 Methyltransferase domain-containing protein [Propionibacterium cyclohexanicum]